MFHKTIQLLHEVDNGKLKKTLLDASSSDILKLLRKYIKQFWF